MTATSTSKNLVTIEELLTQWQNSQPVVRNVLAKGGLLADLHDVMQEVWISLEKSIHNFDPGLGELGGWVGKIAHHRAVDHLNRSVRSSNIQERVEFSVGEDFSVIVGDHAEVIAERDYAHQLLKLVLDTTQEAMDNQTAFDRTMALLVSFDDEVRRAASAMGLSEEALRASKRETLRTAKVIGKALELRSSGATATLRTLLACLPDDSEEDDGSHGSGTWVRHMTLAAARSGGFGHVTPTVLVEVTGWEYNTCRQYLNQTKDLLSIARTVMEYGAGRITTTDKGRKK